MLKEMKRKTAPEITNTSELALELKSCRTFQLDNGVEVYVFEGGSQEVLSIDWVFDAGNSYEQKNCVSAATNFLLRCGTKDMNAYEINETFEYYGAFIKRDNRSEIASLNLHTLTRHIEHLLPTVKKMIYESVFPASELEIYKQNTIQQLRINLKKCDFVASRLIDVSIYGIEHPYGKHSTIEAYEAITREDCLAHYEKYYKNGSFKIFVAGVLPANIDTLLNGYFGQHPIIKNTPAPAIYTLKPAAEKKSRVINDEKGVQGAIRLARPYTNRHDPDFPGVMVLNNILGGYFGSRLMSNIREDKGYTYGIYSYLQNQVHNGAWMISTEAGRDVCEATIEEIYKEMDLLKNELVDDEELLLVRNYMAGQLLSDLDGPFQLIGRWKTYILNGLGLDYFNNYVQEVKTITPEAVRELARKYFDKKDFYEMVVV
jgi:zinc protease